MINYNIAFIGENREGGIQNEAESYFDLENTTSEDLNVSIIDITGMSREEIEAQNIHAVVYDTNIHDGHDQELRCLLESKANPSDIRIFPITRQAVQRKEIQEEKEKIGEILHTEADVLPINIKDGVDTASLLNTLRYSGMIPYRQKVQMAQSEQREARKAMSYPLFKMMYEKSPQTYGHSEFVGKLSYAIAREMGWDEDKCELMRYVGYFHDAGKILTPTSILESKDMLLDGQREEMGLHALASERYFSSDIFGQEQNEAISGHHRWFHESEDLGNEYAFVVEVADCIDAMTAQRNYNNPKTISAAFRDIYRCSRPMVNRNGAPMIDGRTGRQKQQFSPKVARAALVVLGREFAEIGYDPEKFITSTQKEWTKKDDEQIIAVLRGADIKVNERAEPEAYSSILSIRPDETGHIKSANRQAPNAENRKNSEFQFYVYSKFSPEERAKHGSIKELIEMCSKEEIAEFSSKAAETVRRQDEEGRHSVEEAYVGVHRHVQPNNPDEGRGR